jgi:hypothetical protein
MKTFTKHHFAAWQDAPTSTDQGEPEPQTVYSCCTRCKVPTRIGPTGGTKFWVGQKWVTKRPACQVG